MGTPPGMAPGLVQLHTVAEQMWQLFQSSCPGFTVDVLPQVDSTNTHVMQWGKTAFRSGDPLAPMAAVAWHQTAGRGRHGRPWESQPGDCLTLSLGYPLRINWAQAGASALSLAMGVVVCEALRQSIPTLPAQLKWPNDLWVNGRKLAGLLLEVAHRPGFDADSWLVVGVGVNVAGTPVHLAHERCDVSMYATCTTADVMRWVLPALMDGLRQFERHGFMAFKDRYAQCDVLMGREVQLWAPTPEGTRSGLGVPLVQGVAKGVDAHGALLVQDALGSMRAWPMGEVSVRPLTLS
jgi:BirA family transcriptional regulator, biotin operon repressor / biotin---[acetyl-CoA-carboxylase] ligase